MLRKVLRAKNAVGAAGARGATAKAATVRSRGTSRSMRAAATRRAGRSGFAQATVEGLQPLQDGSCHLGREGGSQADRLFDLSEDGFRVARPPDHEARFGL
jgi:hypothetical protein